MTSLPEFLDIDRRAQVLYLLSVVVPSFSLAGVYIYSDGPRLAQMESYAQFDPLLFTSGALIGAAGLSAAAWYLTRKPAVTLAPVAGTLAGLYGGLEDVAVYLFCTVREAGRCQGVSGLPAELPWLSDSGISAVAKVFGFNTVTDTALLVSTGVTVALGYGALVLLDSEVFEDL